MLGHVLLDILHLTCRLEGSGSVSFSVMRRINVAYQHVNGGKTPEMDDEAFQDLLKPVIPAEGLGFHPGLPSTWIYPL